jgi:hypothetical protein
MGSAADHPAPNFLLSLMRLIGWWGTNATTNLTWECRRRFTATAPILLAHLIGVLLARPLCGALAMRWFSPERLVRVIEGALGAPNVIPPARPRDRTASDDSYRASARSWMSTYAVSYGNVRKPR